MLTFNDMKMMLKPRLLVAILAVATVMLSLTAAAQSSAPTNNLSGLLLWWQMDEGTGTTTADSSGNGYTGTLTGSPKWVPGLINEGLSFSSGSSQSVSSSGPGKALAGATGATLCGWVNTSSTFSLGFNDTTGQRFSIVGTGGKVYWQVENGASSYPSCPFKPDTNWHWFVLTYTASPSMDLSNITAYIDGLPQGLTAGGSSPSTVLSSSLGNLSVAHSAANGSYDTMQADDIRLYNRPLTSDEITNLYQWPTGGRYVPTARELSGAETYYIDYSAGSDSNTGLSTNSPWQRQPYQQGFAGTYTHHTGDVFIFRGGVVWPSNCFMMQITAGGSAGVNDNYGVDSNWFAGSEFTRPAFDGGHWAPNLVVPGASYLSFNSLELRAIQCNAAASEGLVVFANLHDITFTNCWLHDWSLTNSITTDDAHGGLICSFNGGYGITNIIMDHCEISNLENTNRWSGVCVREAGVFNYCQIHDNSSGILFAQDVNHCSLYNICYPYSGFDPTYHWNGFYMDNPNGNGVQSGVACYLRNSYVYNVGGGANMAYPNPDKADCYIYNNVFYGTMSSQLAIEVDPYAYGWTGTVFSTYVYNNTVVNYASDVPAVHIVPRSGVMVSNLFIYNNHVIGTTAFLTDASSSEVVNLSSSNNLIQTPAQALAQGYGLANLYAPGSSTAGTVGLGMNAPAAVFANDIQNNIRPHVAWDIGAYQYQSALSAPSNLRVVSSP
jgi:hypothetical protein